MADTLHHSDIEATPTRARQGVKRSWTTRVLIVSTLAAAAGLFVYFALYVAPVGPM